MNCPSCQTTLSRTKYSNANIFECASCRGVLLKTKRANMIQRRIDKDVAQLQERVHADLKVDTVDEIRCPQCRAKMQKRKITLLSITIDDCRQCEMSWFDGGELALIQLAYENRDTTAEVNSMRQRLKDMTAAQRQEYEQRIASLRVHGDGLEAAIRGAIIDMTLRSRWWF